MALEYFNVFSNLGKLEFSDQRNVVGVGERCRAKDRLGHTKWGARFCQGTAGKKPINNLKSRKLLT